MQDRQLRITQRGPVQSVELLPLYILKRAGVPVDHDGDLRLVATSGIQLLKGTFILGAAAASGAWTIETVLDTPKQVFGTWGMSGSVDAATSAKIDNGIISALSTLPAAVAGDVITIQGVL